MMENIDHKKGIQMNLLKKGLLRGTIPFILLTLVSLWLTYQGLSVASNHAFFMGLIAFFLGVTSVIYEIQGWRFIKQIFVHYVLMLVTVFPTLLLSGMYPLDSIRDVVNVYFLFNIVGVILFLITHLIFQWRYRAYMKAQKQ
ncbi:DUF3021 domain-containing protein [Rossellomorea aquimaris]|uniref:DUF3021 family protein n=1 Tax=Rossellomorea aquimaris TaxID=189382 RepID=UPI001CD60046|nr:DUF3021 family protein [Rossellomorea aquimaris]MCA1060357.1 DUF3021 domain-containing protein [Rossellomorea aquimaris]